MRFLSNEYLQERYGSLMAILFIQERSMLLNTYIKESRSHRYLIDKFGLLNTAIPILFVLEKSRLLDTYLGEIQIKEKPSRKI